MPSNLDKQRRKMFLKLYVEFQDCIKTQPIWGATISHFDFDLEYPEQWPIETRSLTYGLGTLVLPDFQVGSADLATATDPATADDIARSAGDRIMKVPSQSFNVSISVLPKLNDKAAAEKFVELLSEAGSAMTESLRSLIPLNGSSSGMPNSPSGLFLAFMFWSKPLSNEEVLKLAELGWVHWTYEPCGLAKDTIERCGLTDKSPSIFNDENSYPTWTGNLACSGQVGPDGAIPGGFRYLGINYHGKLTGKAWKLVDYLWKQGKDGASFDDLAKHVWDDSQGDGAAVKNKFRGLQNAAKMFFESKKIPLKIVIDGKPCIIRDPS